MSGNPRILIADDEPEVVDTLRSILGEQTNYDVCVATSAFEAGVQCERFRPHVMLLDIHLTPADGKDVCEIVRNSDDLQVTRIIAMSGKLTEGQIGQLRQYGFDGALKKPFSVRQVIDTIETANAVVY